MNQTRDAIRTAAAAGPVYRPLGTFRFLLALMVVAQHFTNIGPLGFRSAVAPLEAGSLAVLAFFAVSGFVIAEAIETFYRSRPAAFLTNRVIRIFPPLLATFALTVAVLGVLFLMGPVAHPDVTVGEPLHPSVLSARNLVANVLWWLPGLKSLLGAPDLKLVVVAWSIRVEVLFYLVMAGLLVLPARWYRPGLMATAAAMLALFGAFVAGKGPDVLQFVPYFVFGVALFYALTGHRVALVPLALAIAGCAAQMRVSVMIDNPALVAAYGAMPHLSRAALLTGCLALIPLLASMSAGRWQRIDQFLGDMSYPVYLNHCIVLPAVRTYAPDLSAVGLAAVLVYVLALSYVMHALVEPTLVRLRARIRRAGTEPPAQAADAPLPRRVTA